MMMPGRKYSANGGYRYGFNGKEKGDEIVSDDYDFGARIYDGRFARWLSVDPLQSKYPDLSPYNFAANSPLNAIDPDGKIIIFINGLWGFPMGIGKGGTVDYWGVMWVGQAQDDIGDHKKPRYYDGSMGGTMKFGGKSSLYEKNRIAAGKVEGYKDAKTIIDNLDKDETIKFVTNSMGAAFERGFSEGLFKYRDERLVEIGTETILASFEKIQLEKQIDPDRLKELNGGILFQPKTELEKKYRSLKDKISALNSEKEKLNNLQIEMVIDLSAHQTDKADPYANANYYMTAEENITMGERIMGVDEKKHINHSTYLGKMGGHHSSWADTHKFPKAAKPN
jgi:RHS repeat-associated protein